MGGFPHPTAWAAAAVAVASVPAVGGDDPGKVAHFRDFQEENFVCNADPGFVSRCVPAWQEECRATYSRNPELRDRLCETKLERNYVRIRTLIPQNDILEQWTWDKRRRDFDEDFFRTKLPKFTPEGFKLLRMPPYLHEAMREWYGKHKHLTRPESSQPAFGMHCNTGHDNDDWVVPYAASTPKERELFDAVREWIRGQLAQWTGQDVAENTAIYGARQYHRGSICGMHTDAIFTHAFSAIYQLDQFGMDEPWALDYVTHGGEEGAAYLNAGDVMLYESATGLHGRKTPLKGDEFTNIFFHFRSPSWQPSVESIMKGYWTQRQSFEKTMGRLTSLADAPKLARNWGPADQCLPLRSRNDPLMVQGHFMDTPQDSRAQLETAKRAPGRQPPGVGRPPLAGPLPAAPSHKEGAAAAPQMPATAPSLRTFAVAQEQGLEPIPGAGVIALFAVVLVAAAALMPMVLGRFRGCWKPRKKKARS